MWCLWALELSYWTTDSRLESRQCWRSSRQPRALGLSLAIDTTDTSVTCDRYNHNNSQFIDIHKRLLETDIDSQSAPNLLWIRGRHCINWIRGNSNGIISYGTVADSEGQCRQWDRVATVVKEGNDGRGTRLGPDWDSTAAMRQRVEPWEDPSAGH